MSVCIPTYMLASGLIAGGMSWWQAIRHHPAGQPDRARAHAAQRPCRAPSTAFLSRSSCARRSACAAPIFRPFCARWWPADGSASRPGSAGRPSTPCCRILWPGAAGLAGGIWICFFAFWALNIAVIWRGIETIKFLEGIGAPFMLGIGLLLLWWITGKAGGFGPVLSAPSKFHTSAEFFRFFIPSLTGMVGFWATVALNIPDFTRYAKSQKAQVLGQALGLPTAMTLYSFIGVAVTSASVVLFGEADLGPGRAAGQVQPAHRRVHRADRAAGGHAQHQRRGQRGFALQRFFQSESAPDFVSHRRPDHRSDRRADDAVETADAISARTFSAGWWGTRACWGPSPA